LHDRHGSRVLGFDNAHRIGKQGQFDHWHRSSDDLGRRYAFESPEKLLADFWQEVDRVLNLETAVDRLSSSQTPLILHVFHYLSPSPCG